MLQSARPGGINPGALMREETNMAFIQVLVAAVALGILYARMLRWEVPEPVGKAQALVPVALGLVSIIFSTLLMLGIGFLLAAMGTSVAEIKMPVLRSVAQAFLVAGFPEEIAKFLMMLLSFKLFRPKNVYEYILIGFAVGAGFTVHEEFIYGGSAVGLARMVTLALHSVFGVVMARYLGLARHRKLRGDSGAGLGYVFALVVPMLAHTVYDACTAFNPAIAAAEENGDVGVFGIVVGIAAIVGYAVWQVVVLVRLKKRAAKYSAIQTVPAHPVNAQTP